MIHTSKLDPRSRPFLVISGLPASGKSTLGSILAKALQLPLLDKDAILEELFDAYGDVDATLRKRLSRQSDALFQARAEATMGAVLVSFWRHPKDNSNSGTPTAWLSDLSNSIVEVHCMCSPKLAEQRFRARVRHPGHNDTSRAETLASQLDILSQTGPLGVGKLKIVRTDRPVETEALLVELRNLLGPTRERPDR